MTDLREVIESELQKLAAGFDAAEVKRMRRPPPAKPRYAHPHPTEQTPESIPLPGFEARWEQRKFSLDFAPWQNETCLMSIYMSAASPVKLALVLKQGQVQAFQQRSVSTANPGSLHASIEERYEVETNGDALASQLLADPAIEAIIDQLGAFERLALDARFVKLSRHIEQAEDVAAERITADVEALGALALKLEEPVPTPEP